MRTDKAKWKDKCKAQHSEDLQEVRSEIASLKERFGIYLDFAQENEHRKEKDRDIKLLMQETSYYTMEGRELTLAVKVELNKNYNM